MKWVRPLISLAEGSLAAASDALEDAAAAFGEGAEEAARMGAADMRWRLLAAKADALRSSGRGAEADAAREEASAVVEAMEALFADDSLMRTFGESARQRLAQPTEAGTA
jgi:hypothetical protein